MKIVVRKVDAFGFRRGRDGKTRRIKIGTRHEAFEVPESLEDLAQRHTDEVEHERRRAAAAKVEYRRERAREYAATLGAEPGFESAVGDVLDALIDAVTGGDQSKLAAIKAKRDSIKLRFPKPPASP